MNVILDPLEITVELFDPKFQSSIVIELMHGPVGPPGPPGPPGPTTISAADITDAGATGRALLTADTPSEAFNALDTAPVHGGFY
jgi:hypothetical protein